MSEGSFERHWDEVSLEASGDALFVAYSERLWYVNRGGETEGPFSTWELALAAKSAVLLPSDNLWRQGLPRWYPAAEVRGLLPRSDLGTAAPPSQQQSLGSHEVDRVNGRSPGPLEAWRSEQHLSIPVPTSRETTLGYGHERGGGAGLNARHRESLSPSSGLPALQPPASSTLTTEKTVTLRAAENISLQVVQILDRYEIKCFDDIATNERLRQLTGLSYDALPLALRATLNHSVGRPFVEERIFDLLVMARATLLSPDARTADLRAVVLDQAPVVARAIDAAIAGAKSSVASAIATRWASLTDKLSAQGGEPMLPLADSLTALPTR